MVSMSPGTFGSTLLSSTSGSTESSFSSSASDLSSILKSPQTKSNGMKRSVSWSNILASEKIVADDDELSCRTTPLKIYASQDSLESMASQAQGPASAPQQSVAMWMNPSPVVGQPGLKMVQGLRGPHFAEGPQPNSSPYHMGGGVPGQVRGPMSNGMPGSMAPNFAPTAQKLSDRSPVPQGMNPHSVVIPKSQQQLQSQQQKIQQQQLQAQQTQAQQQQMQPQTQHQQVQAQQQWQTAHHMHAQQMQDQQMQAQQQQAQQQWQNLQSGSARPQSRFSQNGLMINANGNGQYQSAPQPSQQTQAHAPQMPRSWPLTQPVNDGYGSNGHPHNPAANLPGSPSNNAQQLVAQEDVSLFLPGHGHPLSNHPAGSPNDSPTSADGVQSPYSSPKNGNAHVQHPLLQPASSGLFVAQGGALNKPVAISPNVKVYSAASYQQESAHNSEKVDERMVDQHRAMPSEMETPSQAHGWHYSQGGHHNAAAHSHSYGRVQQQGVANDSVAHGHYHQQHAQAGQVQYANGAGVVPTHTGSLTVPKPAVHTHAVPGSLTVPKQYMQGQNVQKTPAHNTITMRFGGGAMQGHAAAANQHAPQHNLRSTWSGQHQDQQQQSYIPSQSSQAQHTPEYFDVDADFFEIPPEQVQHRAVVQQASGMTRHAGSPPPMNRSVSFPPNARQHVDSNGNPVPPRSMGSTFNPNTPRQDRTPPECPPRASRRYLENYAQNQGGLLAA